MARQCAGVMLSGCLLFLAGCAAGFGGGGAAVDRAAVVATIPIGEGPIFLALSADGNRLYAAATKALTAIDTTNNTVRGTVPLTPYRSGLALTPDGSRALVSTLRSVDLTVIDVRVLAALGPIRLLPGAVLGGFGRIAVTPDSRTAFVVNALNEVLNIVDLGGEPTRNMLMGIAPFDVAVSPDGRTAYISGCKNFCATGTIQAVDIASQRFTSTAITVGGKPYRLALSPDGTRAYTANLGGATVSVVDLAAQQAIATVNVSVQPTSLAVAPDGTRLYVASQPVGTITVIDTGSNTVVAAAQVADDVREVVITPDGRRLDVSTTNSVLAIDPARLGAGG